MMSSLRKAAKETLRTLGINFPTALTVILGIGFAIVFADKFSTPETKSVAGFLLWLFETIGWLAAVAVVFLPLLLCNLIKTERREQSIRAKLRMVAEIAASEDDHKMSFLRNVLGDPCYGVIKCYAFASVVRCDPTRDVDIVIMFDSNEEKIIRIYRDRIRDIEMKFQEFHGLGLHLQTFLADEDDAMSKFLARAGENVRII